MGQKLEDQLVRHEGMKLFPYRCTEKRLTIGVGRNIQDRGINEAEALFLLKNDIQQITCQLVKHKWFTELSEVRRDIIVNMGFMGVAKVLQFKVMIFALSRQEYTRAADEMLNSKWAKQVGNRSKELSLMMIENRYLTEAELSAIYG